VSPYSYVGNFLKQPLLYYLLDNLITVYALVKLYDYTGSLHISQPDRMSENIQLLPSWEQRFPKNWTDFPTPVSFRNLVQYHKTEVCRILPNPQLPTIHYQLHISFDA